MFKHVKSIKNKDRSFILSSDKIFIREIHFGKNPKRGGIPLSLKNKIKRGLLIERNKIEKICFLYNIIKI